MSINNRIAILGNSMSWSLEASYQRAFTSLGYTVSIIDVPQRINAKLPFKRIMSRLRNVLNDRKWLKEANRQIAIEILELKPKAVIIFCNAEILFNTIALLKVAADTQIVLIWPDTPFNISPEVRLAAPLYDLVCSYSSAAVPVFQTMGFRNVIWLPLGADPHLHGMDTPPNDFVYDISFIGHWRPEREAALSAVSKAFKDQRIRITGLFWKENVKDKSILAHLNPIALNGRAYTDFIHQSYINLNIIDQTNYPSANMRFFEVLVAYGFQLSSSCPEQDSIFIDNEDVMYFKDYDQLIEKAAYGLSHKEKIKEMRFHAHEKVMNDHTYTHRAKKMLMHLDL